jgi:predicted house-cleaning NTP pyrophosphatase (Maf/HAM1 superfamily)
MESRTWRLYIAIEAYSGSCCLICVAVVIVDRKIHVKPSQASTEKPIFRNSKEQNIDVVSSTDLPFHRINALDP